MSLARSYNDYTALHSLTGFVQAADVPEVKATRIAVPGRAGRTLDINHFVHDQTVGSDGAMSMEATPQAKRDLQAAANAPTFTPRVAMGRMFKAAAVNGLKGEHRVKAQQWLRRENTLRGKGGRAADRHQIETGRKLVAAMTKQAPTVVNKVDRNNDLRHSIGAGRSRNLQDARLNTALRQGRELAIKNARPPLRPTTHMLNLRNPYAVLKGVAKALNPEALALNLIAGVAEAALGVVGAKQTPMPQLKVAPPPVLAMDDEMVPRPRMPQRRPRPLALAM